MRSGFFRFGVLITALAMGPISVQAAGHGGGGHGGGGGGHSGGGHGGGGGGGHASGGFHGGGGHPGGAAHGGSFHGGGGSAPRGGGAMHSMPHGGGAAGAQIHAAPNRGGMNIARGPAQGSVRNSPPAIRSASPQFGNMARGGAPHNSNFAQRNFTANSRPGFQAGQSGQRASPGFATRNFTARPNTSSHSGIAATRPGGNFAAQHFGAASHATGFRPNTTSLARVAPTHNANLAGARGAAGLTTGHLHSQWFGAAGHSNALRQTNFAHHSTNLAQNFNTNSSRNFNTNFNVNRNFNSRWSGGWNHWHNRSFFFGGSTPFGSYYRGYYPWYRTGFWPRFAFGFFPYYGYGYGYGYPYSFGYPGYYGYASYLNCYYPYSYGYGYGYPGYASYGYSYPTYVNNYYSYPAYGASTYAAPGYTTYNSYAAADTGVPGGPQYSAIGPAPAPDDARAPDPPVIADTAEPAGATAAAARSVDDITAADFAGQGEINFKAGKYEAAIRDFRHALVDDPTNAGVLMLLGQSLFAAGQYDEAAGATAMAMQALPQDKWGVVIENYRQLYGNPADFTSQLRALEKARDAKPDSPGLRFLLGFQYAYLGYPSEAVRELDKTVQLEPKDQMAKTLRDAMAAKTKDPKAIAPPGGPAPGPAAGGGGIDL